MRKIKLTFILLSSIVFNECETAERYRILILFFIFAENGGFFCTMQKTTFLIFERRVLLIKAAKIN